MHEHSHYYKDVSHLRTIDVYRVLSLFNVNDPCIQHAVKKLLVAGGRGAKDAAKDVQEAIDSLKRWAIMRQEDDAIKPSPIGAPPPPIKASEGYPPPMPNTLSKALGKAE